MTLGEIIEAIHHGGLEHETIVRMAADLIVLIHEDHRIECEHSSSQLEDLKRRLQDVVVMYASMIKNDNLISGTVKVYATKLGDFEPAGD